MTFPGCLFIATTAGRLARIGGGLFGQVAGLGGGGSLRDVVGLSLLLVVGRAAVAELMPGICWFCSKTCDED